MFAAALAVGLLTIALLFGALLFWSQRVDAADHAREVQLASNGVESRKTEIEDSLTAVTQWDDAVAHTDGQIDNAWVDTNIGVFLDQSLHMDRGVLLDASDAPVYATRLGVETPADALPELVSAARPLVRAVRLREAARGPFPASTDGANVISTPIRVSAGAMLYGKPHLVTATLVQPDFGKALPKGPRAPILVSSVDYDAAFRRLAADYQLDRPRLMVGLREVGAHEARAFLRGPDGRPVATVAWSPQRPGQSLLMSALPAVTAATVVLGFGLLLAMGFLRTNLRSLHKAMDELVGARDAAEAANHAKSQFLATIGHELRTPLNGVLGMAQALSTERLTRAQHERVGIIRQSGESLLAVFNDLLDLSKIEARTLELEMVAFDLDDLVRGVVATYQPLAAKSGLTFEFEVSEPAQGRYLGDSARIRRILYSLCDNAVKFTHAGGCTLRVARDAGQVVFRVADTGVGISGDDLGRLFEGFFQGDSSRTRRYGGAGVGLAICERFTTLMGGVIEASSKLGEGSTFSLRLPLERTEAVEPNAADIPLADAHQPGELRVLAAEDNVTNQLVLKTLLAPLGVAPTLVANGCEAVAAWESQLWDIVLMDIQMPEMDGVEAVRTIRRRELETGRPRTPILAVTANAMAHQVVEYAAAGMDGVVAKPVDAARLCVAMEQALAQADAA